MVMPTSASGTTWSEVAATDSNWSTFAQDHWLGNYRRLPEELPEDFVAQRNDFHRLAYGVVAQARFAATGKFGLRYTYRGFGTPFFGEDIQVRVAGGSLIVQEGLSVADASITSLQDAGLLASVTPGTDAAEGDSPELGDLSQSLNVSSNVNDFLGDWFGLGASVLEELRLTPSGNASRVQLWPGHFDLATELGDLEAGQRATYGFSPGDANHAEPYVYVAAWGEVDRSNPLWNDPHFNGASMPYAALVEADDQRQACLGFFRQVYPALVGENT